MPFRAEYGMGPVVAGVCYLDLVFVVPERWGDGVGGHLVTATFDEARRRGYSEIRLWTHEGGNERAQRLYERRGFSRTGDRRSDEEGAAIAEWARSLDELCSNQTDDRSLGSQDIGER